MKHWHNNKNSLFKTFSIFLKVLKLAENTGVNYMLVSEADLEPSQTSTKNLFF